jgi:glycosyltransferase involved in cell wall biosynthesis
MHREHCRACLWIEAGRQGSILFGLSVRPPGLTFESDSMRDDRPRLTLNHTRVLNPMRILNVVQAYFPFQDRGGPVFKVRSLAAGLAKRGHSVAVLTADLGISQLNGSRTEITPSRWGWTAHNDNVETIYLPTVGHYRAATLNPRLLPFCRASIRDYEMVHFFGLYDLLGPPASYFCRRQSIPYVIEPIGMFRPIVRSLRLKRMYFSLMGNRFVQGARYLIATSEQEKQELLGEGIGKSRIVIRRNGAELPESPPAAGAFRRLHGIRDSAKLILFLGRLVSKKSPDLLLEAFARWRVELADGRDGVLVLAGPDEGDGFLAHLQSMTDRLAIRDEVIFTGPLYDDAKWSAYRDADLFVLPSQNENFGNTAGEAAACGTPVIVTDRCGVAPLVGRAGEVIPHDLAALQRALSAMLGDPKLRENRRDGCREFVNSLSWEEPLDQTEEMYRQCTEAKP